MYYIYLLQSLKDNSLYIGSASDLRSKLLKHLNGEVANFAIKRPWKLIWYCVFPTKKQAMNFEAFLKQAAGLAFARKHLI